MLLNVCSDSKPCPNSPSFIQFIESIYQSPTMCRHWAGAGDTAGDKGHRVSALLKLTF